MKYNLVDSCGWLEYFADSARADFFAPAIEDIEHLVIPSICIAEVFKVLLREKDETTALVAVSAMGRGAMVPLDVKLSLEAARWGVSCGLPLADSIIYATAKEYGATIFTQDRHFENLPGVKFVDKIV